MSLNNSDKEMYKLRKSVLVIRMSALGDAAMTIPVIYSFAWQYPHHIIYVLTRKEFETIFINKPANIETIGVELRQHHGLKGTIRLIRMLNKYNIDEVADFHNVLRSWIIDIYMMMRGRKVVMLDKKRHARLITTGFSHRNQESFIDRYSDVLKKLGYEIKLTFNSLFQEKETICPLSIENKAIGIAPFARYQNKTYPLELMERAISLLCQKGYNVYLFGAKGEESDILGQLARRYKNCISLAGRYALEEELAVMHYMLVMVSMDSANQHLASLTGTKVVTIWGSTTPACGFMPYRQDAKYSICKGISCQPCSTAGGKRCRKNHFRCMTSIEPEEIINKIEETIQWAAR